MIRPSLLSILLSTTLAAALHASIQSDIGFTELKAEYGSALPDGSNLSVLMVEAPDTSGNWAVKKSGELGTRQITYPLASAAPTTYSSHAQTVATNLTGTTTSILPSLGELQVSCVAAYRALSLHVGVAANPCTTSWDLENHSLISNITTYNLNALKLLDYRIIRDQVTVVIALENGTNAMQPLWGNNYNTIAVGTATGKHSRGGTNLEGSGRQKPDLVGTATYTSYATPVVTSAAGLIIAEAKRTAALAAAKDPRVVKALLMAGATKEEFATWSHTSAQPLDPIYGAGQVNIYNSYKMLLGGRQAAGAIWQPSRAWDLGKTSNNTVYYFEVPAGQTMKFSTVLTWYRELATTDYWTFTGALADLSLRLYNSTSNFALGTVVAESTSALDNVEHIYCPNLPAGKYALQVSGPAGTAYGIAWDGTIAGSTSSTTAQTATLVAPQISAQPASLSVTAGNAATFCVTASGSSLAYQWCKNGTPLTGATAASFTIAATSLDSAGSYTATVSNSAGSATSAAATLTVAAAPEPSGTLIELVPTAFTARGDNSAKGEGLANLFDHNTATKWLDFKGTTWIQVTLESPQPLASYSFTAANDYPVRDPANWSVLGSNDGSSWTTIETRSGETFASRNLQRDFVLSQTSPAYRYFRFEITCNSGSITQLAELELYGESATTKTTSVQIAAPTITAQPAAIAVTAGAPATFAIAASGDSLSYQWYKDNAAIPSATTSTYTIDCTATADAGSYTVIVQNSAGAVGSNAAILTVAAAPAVGSGSGALVELTPSSYSARGQNSSKGEGLAQLFDHSTTTKWLDFKGTTWIQVSYSTPHQLESYSFTSANDYDVRDPYTWTLSGSNDGTTWSVIETQTAQTFAARQQQHDFVLSAPSASYRYFRFDIVCKSGAITQLAELELWGH